MSELSKQLKSYFKYLICPALKTPRIYTCTLVGCLLVYGVVLLFGRSPNPAWLLWWAVCGFIGLSVGEFLRTKREQKTSPSQIAEVYTITREGFILKESEENFKKGFIIFLSLPNDVELGKLGVMEYRKLRSQPFKEPLTYLLQFSNCLWVLWRFVSSILLLSPITYFWVLVVIAAYGGLDLKALSVMDLFSPPLLHLSIVIAGLAVFLPIIFRGNVPGFEDMFEMRFRRILDNKFPPLKELEKFKMKWEPATA